MTLEHKTSHESHEYIYSNSQQYTVWVKIIDFSIMPKIIGILSKDHVNISKLNFWLVICIAKNLICTTLKMIFSIFSFFCSLRFQIFNSCISAKYCPIITNHTSMEILFIHLKKLTLVTGFVKSSSNPYPIIPLSLGINRSDWLISHSITQRRQFMTSESVNVSTRRKR